MPLTTAIASEVWTAALTRLSSFLPTRVEIRTLVPMDNPTKRFKKRLTTTPLAPTAAKACLPTN